MRTKIPALVADITLATSKHNHWVAEVKTSLRANGPAHPYTRKAQRLAEMWAEELEAKQDELDLEADGEEVAYHTEYAEVD